MAKWADFLISEVSYGPNHLIKIAKRHSDSNNEVSSDKNIDRLTIASDIKKGLSYMTVYSGLATWKKGHKINVFRINGEPFLRIDGNKVPLDNLGDLPEIKQNFQFDNKEQIHNNEKPPQNPRGSLPKDTGTELSQELELAPEPISESELEEATPEQLARLEKLEKQIQELESAEDLESEIIKLREQNKKLDQIEQKIHYDSTPSNLNSKIKSTLNAYCVKCKSKREIKNPQGTIMKNGRSAVKGNCSFCGGKVFRIVKKEIIA